ncbi:hypothetical protein BVRB_039740 [Beta vulgaris subsp. vulgaris]|uniref:Uncharacterized protein n=1 Tax=Beta vulgaris subsp. vulgaris TaxID=3555 RepID=A0A0J7YNB9_BETVV|nr:hypothetical protein BVRB_039740 [Beta vulgaris subsp. vulgaris]
MCQIQISGDEDHGIEKLRFQRDSLRRSRGKHLQQQNEDAGQVQQIA